MTGFNRKIFWSLFIFFFGLFIFVMAAFMDGAAPRGLWRDIKLVLISFGEIILYPISLLPVPIDKYIFIGYVLGSFLYSLLIERVVYFIKRLFHDK